MKKVGNIMMMTGIFLTGLCLIRGLISGDYDHFGLGLFIFSIAIFYTGNYLQGQES